MRNKNPILRLISRNRVRDTDAVGGVDLAPGITSENSDMLQKDFIMGVSLGKAGRWAGIGMPKVIRLRQAVNDGLAHEDPKVQQVVQRFQQQAQPRIAHLDEVQRFGFGGRGDAKDADYMASMRDMQSTIDKFLSEYDREVKASSQRKRAEEARRRAEEARIRAQEQAAQAAEQAANNPQPYPPQDPYAQPQQPYYDPYAYQPQYGQNAPSAQVYYQPQYAYPEPAYYPEPYYGGGSYADAYYDQYENQALMHEWDEYAPADPYAAADGYYDPYAYDPYAGSFVGAELPVTVDSVPMLQPEFQADALVNLAGRDGRADYLINGLVRLKSDSDFAMLLADGDPQDAADLQEEATAIVARMRQGVGSKVQRIIGGNDESGSVEVFAASLLPLLPDVLISAMQLVKQAQAGNQQAIAQGSAIRTAASEGDPLAQQAMQALTIANQLNNVTPPPRTANSLPANIEPKKDSLYQAGMEG